MNRSRDDAEGYGWRNRDLERKNKKKHHHHHHYTKEERDYKDRFARGEENVHVVCVDERDESKRAIKFAFDNVPRDHRLLLVHGHYDSTVADTIKDRPSVEDLRSRFMRLCKNQGRSCEFKSFDYRSNSDFGDKVCVLAKRNDAKSVIVGKRDDVSDTRRSIIGSGSQSVLSSCGLPVTVVQSEAHLSWL